MANTIIRYGGPSGLAIKLELYPSGSNVIANTLGGDTFVEETDAENGDGTGFYLATVTENLAGNYRAVIKSGASVLDNGWVYDLADDTDTYEIVKAAPAIPTISGAIPTADPVVREVGQEEPIRFTFPAADLADGDFTKQMIIGSGSVEAVNGAITYLGEFGGFYWYELAYDAGDRPAGVGTVRFSVSDGTTTLSFELRVVTSIEGIVTDIDYGPGDGPYEQNFIIRYKGVELVGIVAHVSTDEAGTDIIRTNISDECGVVRFSLDSVGQYYLQRVDTPIYRFPKAIPFEIVD